LYIQGTCDLALDGHWW